LILQKHTIIFFTSQKIYSLSQVLVAHAFHPSYLGGEIRRTEVQVHLRQIVQETPSPKNQTRAGGVVQVVECLPSKHETPSLNPSTEKRKKERKNNQTEWTSSEDQALQV
jgi:hypothetical protein